MNYPQPLIELIENLQQLPGVGPKTAERMALYVITKLDEQDVLAMSKALIASKHDLMYCEVCGNISQNPKCLICLDNRRDQTTYCVVQDAKDVLAFERMGMFKGVYHVLGGVLSPMEGIGPEDLRIIELLTRIKEAPEVEEVIIATNPNMEGEATAQYIQSILAPTGINITRIAHGLPVGGDLDYADEATIMKALEGRRSF
ncbi:MAG: recombination mediator RecR [Culicoidibacterales bacterium]